MGAPDPNASLEALIGNLRAGSPQGPAPQAPGPVPAAPGAPAAAGGAGNLSDHLIRRLDALEGQVRDERAKAAAAEARLQSQEQLRRQVDEELRRSQDAMRQAQADAHARGRIEGLEGRLDALGDKLMAPRPDAALDARLAAMERRLEEILRGGDFPRLQIARQALEEAEERLRVLSAGLAAQAADAQKVFEDAKAAAMKVTSTLAGLAPRQDLLDGAAELMERQRRTEEKLAETLKRLREKDEVISKLSQFMQDTLKRGSP